MDCFVGTSGYSYKEWKGTFYPAKLPANRMLGHYAGQLPAVEINNTFYRPPSESVLAAWAAQVPEHFRFALKAPQEITHVRRLAGAGDLVLQLADAAGTLGRRLGPILFQLPPNFRKDAPLLRDFLAELPRGCRAALEFRHESWFTDEVFALLRDHDAALCVADADDGPEVPLVATAAWGYLRLRRADYPDDALNLWAGRIRAQGWGECFAFFKHEDAGTGPRFAARLRELLATDSPISRRRAA